tara:strand:+ start:2320 stop:2613 length:294 start_codon:yes stop_codon:yes gene_type:complete
MDESVDISMPTFTFSAVDEDGLCTTTKEFETVFLNDAVEHTEDFLRGVGFCFEDLRCDYSDDNLEAIPDLNVVKSDSGPEFKPRSTAYKENFKNSSE